MTDHNQDNPLEGAISNLFGFISAKDDSTQLLISNLVDFLAEKGVINLDEYLEHTEKTKNKLLGKISSNTDQEGNKQIMTAIEQTFTWHVNDFKKPD